MARKLPRTGGLLALALLMALPACASATTRFAAITLGGRAITFDADSPGAIRTAARVSGLSDAEEHLAAIALRLPQGNVYALGTANRLYVLDPRGGIARPVTPGLIQFNLRGFYVGLDLDPLAGSLRVVNEADQNFRLDPFTGLAIDHHPSSPAVEPDGDLRYADGDPSAGTNPNVSAIAYSPSGQLFGIDTARDTLVTIAPADDGGLRTIGRLGIDAEDPAGFDINETGAWATFRRAGSAETGLYRISLARGRATKPLRANAIGSAIGGSVDPPRSMLVLGDLPGDRRKPRFSVAARSSPPVRSLLRGRPLKLAGACNEACTLTVRLVLGARTVGRASTRIRDTGGRKRFNLVLSARGRRLVRRARSGRLRLRAAAVDAAGNRSSRR